MPALTSSSSGARRRYLWAAAVTVLLVLALAAPVRAADTPFDFSAGDQYVETLPTTKGPKATDRPSKHRRSGLSPKAKQGLARQGGSAAAALAEVATSPELGAPATTGSGSASSGGESSGSHKARAKQTGDGSRSVPSAAIKAAGGSSAGIGWLALGLPLITAIALGAFGVQRHRNRDAS
jgi:hypothetical protein